MKSKANKNLRTRPPGSAPKKRLNIKLLILLLGIISILALGGVGVVIRQRRHNPDIFRARAEALADQGQYQLAVKQYEKALHYAPSSVSTLMAMAEVVAKQKLASVEKAVKESSRLMGLYQHVLNVSPSHAEAYKRLSDFLYNIGRQANDEAIFVRLRKVAETFLENNKYHPLGLKYKAVALAHLVQLKKSTLEDITIAEQALEKARIMLPDDALLVKTQARFLIRESERLEQARESTDTKARFSRVENTLRNYLQTSSEEDDDELAVQLTLAVLLLEQGRMQEAEELVTALAEKLLARPNPELSLQLANILAQTDRSPQAANTGRMVPGGITRGLRLLETAHQKFPENLTLKIALGQFMRRARQTRDAISVFEEAISFDGPFRANETVFMISYHQAQAAMLLTDCYLGLAEKQEDAEKREKLLDNAWSAIESFEAQRRNTALVSFLKGKVHLLKGELVEAVKKFETASDKFTDAHLESVFLSAAALRRLGETGAAIERLNKISGMVDGRPAARIYRELTLAYLDLKMYEKAENSVDKLLQLTPEDNEALILKSEVMLQLAGSKGKNKEERQASDDELGNTFGQSYKAVKKLSDSGSQRGKVQLVRMLMAVGKMAEARETMEEVWELEPSNVQFLKQLVSLDIATGNREAALERVNQQIKEHPDNQSLYILKNQLTGRKLEIEELVTMLAEGDNPLASQMALYSLHTRIGRKEKAEKALQKAIRINPEHPRVLGIRFSKALAAEDWEEADEIADKAVKLNIDRARGFFWLGTLQREREQYQRAISSFKLGLNERPLFSRGWAMLGDAYQKQGKHSEAEKAFQRALNLRPDFTAALLRLYKSHSARGLDNLALEDLQKAFKMAPDNERVRRLYLAYLSKTAPEKAIKKRLEVAQEYPDDIGNRLQLGLLYSRTEQYRKADNLLGRLVEEHPGDIRTVAAAAENFRLQGKANEGIKLLRGYMQRRGEAKTAGDYVIFGRYLMRCGQTEKGLSVYRKAIASRKPEQYFATRELAEWHYRKRQYEQAAVYYESLFKNIQQENLVIRYVEALINAGQTDKAGEVLDSYANKQGENERTHLLRTLLAMTEQDFETARYEVQQALKENPQSINGYIYRAQLNMRDKDATRRYAAAEDDLKKALSIKPNSFLARRMLVSLYLADGNQQYDKAIAQLKSIIESNKVDKDARVMLARLYLLQENYEKLVRLIAESIRLQPEQPEWYRIRGRAMLQRRNYSQAIKDLEHANDLVARSHDGLLLARAYVLAEKPAKAMEILQQYPDRKNTVDMLALRTACEYLTEETGKAVRTFKQALESSEIGADQESLVLQLHRLVGTKELLNLIEEIRITGYPRAAVTVANIYIKEKKFKEALPILKTVKPKFDKKEDSQRRIMHSMAICYGQLEQHNDAIAVYKELLARDKNDGVAMNNLAYIYVEKLNKPRQALEFAQKAKAIRYANNYTRSHVMDTLGWALYKVGTLDKAQITLRESVRLNPTPYNRLHLAHVLFAQEDPRSAKRQLRLLLNEIDPQESPNLAKQADELLESPPDTSRPLSAPLATPAE